MPFPMTLEGVSPVTKGRRRVGVLGLGRSGKFGAEHLPRILSPKNWGRGGGGQELQENFPPKK